MSELRQTEHVAVGRLKPHPRNYKQHPKEQLDHIAKSIAEHGFYRNIVVANDYTILAGHGVVAAIKGMGLFGPDVVPVIKLDIDPESPAALKVLTGDNEIAKLAESDDRLLTQILRDVLNAEDLLGTGFDTQSLSALVYVSRPIEEIRDKNEAAEWVSMPEFDAGSEKHFRLIVMFANEADREAFVAQTNIRPADRNRDGTQWSGWWPPREAMDKINVIFTDGQKGLF